MRPDQHVVLLSWLEKNAKEGDVLMSVRAPVGDLNIADKDCSIGRGISAISSKESSYIFYLMHLIICGGEGGH